MKTLPFDRAEPRALRVPSPEARSVEAAMERATGDAARRHDVWVVSFRTLDDARGLRQRLDEELGGRTIALVALLDELDGKPAAQALVLAARATADGLKAVFPSTVAQADLDEVVFDLLERQRGLLMYRGVRGQRKAAEAEEERLRGVEDSLARDLKASLASLAGASAPLRPLQEAAAEFERLYVSRALMDLKGDARAARRALGVSRATFYRALEAHKLHHLVKRHDPSGGDER
ncbi:MAG TPA: hypothetical protein VG389_02440 [Myxococcota bacterium]|jgi:hypothetical protein|nr:hypothetical protein [Myxococcota bacterium]